MRAAGRPARRGRSTRPLHPQPRLQQYGFRGKIGTMLETTASWLAALIDGEGSVMLNKRDLSAGAPNGRTTPHYRPVVVIASNTDPRLHDAIRNKLGFGQVYEHKRHAEPDNFRRRRIWTYRLNVAQIHQVMPHVRPWLVIKAEQAELLAEAMEIKRQITPGQPGFLPENRTPLVVRLDEIHLAIRALNTRGREKVTPEHG